MTTKKARRLKRKKPYRASKKQQLMSLKSMFNTSQRHHAIMDALWNYVIRNKPTAATWGIVGAVLGSQSAETNFLALHSKQMVEWAGLTLDEAVQS